MTHEISGCVRNLKSTCIWYVLSHLICSNSPKQNFHISGRLKMIVTSTYYTGLKRPCLIIPTGTGKHYENLPMQSTEFFFGCKNENFDWKKFDVFLIFAPKYRLWVPVRTASARRF